MHTLSATGDKLKLVTGTAATTTAFVSFADRTSTTFQRDRKATTIGSATTTDISGSPAASTQRMIEDISVVNESASGVQTVQFKFDDGTTLFPITGVITLQPGESVHYGETGFTVLDAHGRLKVTTPQDSGFTGFPSAFFKNGAGSTEASGVPYLFARDAGFPGAWTIGSPGVAGRATDGPTETGGCLTYANAGTGENFLTSWCMAGSGTGAGWLVDILWINSGLVVTTTTAQTVNSVAFPARDANGSSNGLGVEVAIFVSVATTNAGAITNCTLNYTNSDGTAGRTGTIASFPATCAAGAVIFFQLQEGDRGVRSIEGITQGTSMVTGTIHLIALRRLAMTGLGSAWIPNPEMTPAQRNPGVRLYDGSCLFPMLIPSTTTTYNVSGLATWMER
jgi:hypothetical protein